MDVGLEITIVRWLLKAVAGLSLLFLFSALRNRESDPQSAPQSALTFTVALAGLAASYGLDALRPRGGPTR